MRFQYYPKWHLSLTKFTDPFGPTINVLAIGPFQWMWYR